LGPSQGGANGEHYRQDRRRDRRSVINHGSDILASFRLDRRPGQYRHNRTGATAYWLVEFSSGASGGCRIDLRSMDLHQAASTQTVDLTLWLTNTSNYWPGKSSTDLKRVNATSCHSGKWECEDLMATLMGTAAPPLSRQRRGLGLSVATGQAG
jgi:hypothetical protein